MRMDRNQLRLDRFQLRLDRFQLRLDRSQLPLDFALSRANFVAAYSLFSDRLAYLTIHIITDDMERNNFILFYF